MTEHAGSKLNDDDEKRSGKTASLMKGACVVLFLVGAVFVGVDPLKLSMVGNDAKFEAKYVKQPSQSVLRSFPRDGESKLSSARKWSVDGGLMGPESLAFDPLGNGPYTGVADGRILKWHGDHAGWQDFAHTAINRSTKYCNQVIGSPMLDLLRKEDVCGRPLGLRFQKQTGDLYIADAYFGLLRVGPNGGQATPLVRGPVNGLPPLTFTNDLDIASDGSVFFTDSSSKYQRRNFFLAVLSGDDSGRLLKYDPKTQETSELVKGLQFPNGVALSKDESFLVIAESIPGRLLRHWLKGEQRGETEVMAVLPGYPDNVRMNEEGDVWVAMHCRRNLASRLSGRFPKLRRAFLQLPLPFKLVYRLFNGATPHGIIARYNAARGELLEVLEDVSGTVVKYASQVDEHDGRLLIASVLLPYIAVYDRPLQQQLPLSS